MIMRKHHWLYDDLKQLTLMCRRNLDDTTEKMITDADGKTEKVDEPYMALVLTVTVGATTAFATGDPLSVINNLSTFIFSLIRAIGLILLVWCCAGWSVFKSHDQARGQMDF